MYREVREKLSEEVTSELQHEVNTLPDELQRTMDKRDPLREQNQKQPNRPTQEFRPQPVRRGPVGLPGGGETGAAEQSHSPLLPISSFYCGGARMFLLHPGGRMC